jgi:filamentous hemagglutinin family protein
MQVMNAKNTTSQMITPNSSAASSPAGSPRGKAARDSKQGTVFSKVARPITAAALALVAGTAHATPEMTSVVRGNVSVNQQGTTMNITASNGSIINYRSFNIPVGSTVRFIQPSSSSRVLNRIQGGTPSRIDGSLLANGRVYLVNPSGVMFGSGAVVNVGQLIAASGNITDQDFSRGRDRITTSGEGVHNLGDIKGSSIALVGPTVSNAGQIVATSGTVVMAAGDEVTMRPMDSRVAVTVKRDTPVFGTASGTGVVNTGKIRASSGINMMAGDLYSVAVRNSGQLTAPNVRIQGGREGLVEVRGTIDASSTTGRGGSVQVTGHNVGVFDANINASGRTGGGQVLLGGDVLGQGELPNAQRVYVNNGTTINADATDRGNGGTVVMYSTQNTVSSGTISARGGEQSGNGGLIETSSQGGLAIDGSKFDASARAAGGQAGTWLIDPTDITITSATASGTFNGSSPDVFSSTSNTATVSGADIVSRIEAGTSVTIQTAGAGAGNGDITIANDAGLIFDGNPSSTAIPGLPSLTLNAIRDIVFDDGALVQLSAPNSAMNVILNSGRNVDMNGNYGAGGLFINNGANSVLSLIINAPGNVDIANSAGASAAVITGGVNAGVNLAINLDGGFLGPIVTLGGTIDLGSGTGSGLANVTAASITLNSGGVITTGNGNISLASLGTNTINGVLQAGGSVNLRSGAGVSGNLVIGSTADIRGSSISLVAGSTDVDNTSIVDLSAASNDVFSNTANTDAPGNFLLRQDAAIADAAAVALFQGGDVNGVNYTLHSTEGDTTIATAANVAGSNFTIQSGTGFFNRLNANLSVNSFIAQGNTIANTATLTTATNAAFNGTLRLDSDLTVNSTGNGDIQFTSTVDSGLTARALVSTTGGTSTFQGNIGSTAPLSALTTNGVAGNGTVVFANTSTATTGNIALNAPSSLQLTGAYSTTTGSFSANNAATLNGATTVAAPGGITFASTINGGQTLATTSAGTTNFQGNIGGTTALTSLTTNGVAGAGTVVFSNTSTATTGNIALNAPSSLQLTGTYSTTTGTFSANNAVTLNGATSVSAPGGITFTSTINGAQTLTTTSAATTAFQGNIGGTTALTSLTTNGSAGTGNTTFTGSTITAANNIAINTPVTNSVQGTITSNNGTVTIGGTTTNLTGNLTVATPGAAAGSNSIILGGTVQSSGGARDLTLNAGAGNLDLATMGSVANPLGQLTTTGSGRVAIDGSRTSTGTSLQNTGGAELQGTHNSSGAFGVSGNATLVGNTSITASSGITFSGTTNGAFDLLLNSATTFTGSVGNTTALNTLTGLAAVTFNGAQVVTTNAQTYSSTVTVGNNLTMRSTAAGISATSGLTPSSNNTRSITIDVATASALGGGFGTLLNRFTTITTQGAGAITANNAFSTGNQTFGNTGGMTISGTYNSAGDVAFNTAVLLAGNSSVAGANVTFANTINTTGATARTLTVDSSAISTFEGVIGGVSRLAALTVNAGTGIVLEQGVLTVGTQQYNTAAGDVTIGDGLSDTDLSVSDSTGGVFFGVVDNATPANNQIVNVILRDDLQIDANNVTFSGTINSTLAETGSVEINPTGGGTAGGVITFGDDIGTSDAISGLVTRGLGSVVFGRADNTTVEVQTAGPMQFLNTGSTTLSGQYTVVGNGGTTGDDFEVAGPAIIATDTVVSASDSAILFSGTVNGVAGGSSLETTATGTGGNVTFTNSIGNTQRLTTLSANASEVLRLGSGVAGSTMVVNTTGSQQIVGTGGVQIASSVTLDSDGTGAAGNITLQGPIDADAAAENRELTINTAGTTAILDSVGDTQTLASLTTDATGSTVLGAGTGTPMAITTTSSVTFNDAVVLADSLVIDSGAVAFNSTLNADNQTNNRALTVSGDTLEFAGNVGTGTDGQLASINATGVTTTIFGTIVPGAPNTNGPAIEIVTTGGQSYLAAQLRSNTTLRGTDANGIDNVAGNGDDANITFGGTVDSFSLDQALAASLTVNTGAATIFETSIGSNQGLLSLLIDDLAAPAGQLGGTTTFGDGSSGGDMVVNTLLGQTYNDAVLLAANLEFNAADADGRDDTFGNADDGNIAFTSTINSTAGEARSLAVNTGARTTFGADIGLVNRLLSISTDNRFGAFDANDITTFGTQGGPAITIRTSNAQTYRDNIELASGTTLSAVGADGTAGNTDDGAITLGDCVIVTDGGPDKVRGIPVPTSSQATTLDDNAGAGENALTINTGGQTNIIANIGVTRRIASLTTDAPGSVNIGCPETGDLPIAINTTGNIDFNDAATLLQDATFSSNGGTVSFDGVLNSAANLARLLTVNTTGVTRFANDVGTSANGRLGRITTDVGGTVVLGGSAAAGSGNANTTMDLQTVGRVDFGEQLVLAQNTAISANGTGTLAATRGQVILRNGIVNETDTARSLSIEAAGAVSNTFTPVVIAGNVGQASTAGADTGPLAGLTFVARPGTLSASQPNFGSILFTRAQPDANGRVVNSLGNRTAIGTGTTSVFTNVFNMGTNQRLVSLGSLSIIGTSPGGAGGVSTIGDMTVIGNLLIGSNLRYNLSTRGPVGANVPDSTALVPGSDFTNDREVSIVASGSITAPVPENVGAFSGEQRASVFATNDIANVSADLRNAGFSPRQINPTIGVSTMAGVRPGNNGFLLGNVFSADGLTADNPATSLAGAIPRESQNGRIPTRATISENVLEALRELDVNASNAGLDDLVGFLVGRRLYNDAGRSGVPGGGPGVRATRDRFDPAAVNVALNTYTAELRPRASEVRDGLAAAWDAYSAANPGGVSASGFEAYLSAAGEGTAANDLAAVKRLTAQMRNIGLTDFEFCKIARSIADKFIPSVPAEVQLQLLGAGDCDQAGSAAPSEAPAPAPMSQVGKGETLVMAR